MKTILRILPAVSFAAVTVLGLPLLQAEDNPSGGEWPQWGRDASNNMYSPATGLPIDFTSGEFNDAGEAEGAKHLKWVTEMGSQA